MIASRKIKQFINTEDFLMYLFGISLSTLLLGYAYSSIGFGLFFFFSLRYFITNKNKVQFTRALILPMFLYLFFLISYLWSVDKNQTLKGFERTLVFALIPLAFAIIPKVSLKNYHLVLKIFVRVNGFMGIFFLGVAVLSYFNNQTLDVFTYHNLVAILELNAIYVSLVFSICLFYLLALEKRTTLETFLTILFTLLLILLSSKMIIIVLFLGSILLFTRKRLFQKNKNRILFMVVIAVGAISIASLGLSKRFLSERHTAITEVLHKEKFGKVYYWTGTSIRIFQLRLLKEQLEEESILLKGFGLFASKNNLRKRHEGYDTYQHFHTYNYHNQYAQTLAELGIIGLFIVLFMLLEIWKIALKQKEYFFIMFCLLMTMIFLTESILWRQRGLFLFIGLYAFLSKIDFKKNRIITDSLE